MHRPRFLRSLASAALLLPHLLAAGNARIAATASAKEFLSGEALGTAITADGKLTLGAPLAPRAWPEDAADAVPFAAVADASGRVIVATGGGLGRVFDSTPDGKMHLLWTAPEPNVTALALAPDGALVCGTSPKGKLYRLDAKGTATPLGETGEAAVWSLAFDAQGTLYAGTGNKGRVWRLRAGGKPEMLAELEDVHVRALLVTRDGRVVAGTSDRGLLVAIAPSGALTTLHDFARPEVIGIAEAPDGTLYAAATNAEPPSVTDGRPRAVAPGPAPSPTPAPGAAPKADEVPKGTVSVSTSTSATRPGPSASAKEHTGGAEVVAIAKDGFVEPAWTFPDETIYSLRWDAGRGGLVLTTGPRGRLYLWKDRHLSLEAQTDQKQAVAAPATAGGFAVVTMNAPGLFRPAPGARSGTFTAAVRDAGRMARFTRLRYEGIVPQGTSLSFSVRGGNSEKPDATWGAWTPVTGDARKEGAAALPAARYFQWRASLGAGASGAAPVLERVEIAYVERNGRPVLENLAVLEPGAVFQRSGGGGATVLSVTNPDESGIYVGLEAGREGGEGPGKKLWRKGFRTITWKGVDPNGDSLRYDVEARREGERSWFPIRRDLDESWISFDTTAMPDGRYRFRVTATDRVSNPEGEELAAQEESPLALVDNTPPVVTVTSAKVEKGEIVVAVSANDALSPITKAEAAVNADRWRPIVPVDGAADSPSESFVFRTKKAEGPAVIAIRVVDASGNAAAAQVELP